MKKEKMKWVAICLLMLDPLVSPESVDSTRMVMKTFETIKPIQSRQVAGLITKLHAVNGKLEIMTGFLIELFNSLRAIV